MKLNHISNKILQRKSQLSIFFLISIFVLLAIGTGVVVYMSNDNDPSIENIEDTIVDANTIITHVESCILKARPVIKSILKNGGEATFSMDPILFEGRYYNKWCLYDSSDGCKNRVFSTTKLETLLNEELKETIDSCINFSKYEKQGYGVTLGESTVTTAVGPLDVTIYLNKPLSFRRGDFNIDQSDFSFKLDIAAGRMYQVANLILNDEIKYNYFDKDAWMKDHGAEFIIEKHKPYPDTVYYLARHDNRTNDWVELQFAIEGYETVNDITSMPSPSPSGWCLEGNICFYNPESTLCSERIASNSGCVNYSNISYPNCIGDSCDMCGNHKSGDQWCEYEGPVGGAMDLVGTRHYLKSCMNGIILTEECRDYREEICVSGSGKSMCRPNRWHTCAAQSSQASCQDSTRRDCVWYDMTNVFNKYNYDGDARIMCVPAVPPGFKFWNYGGSQACQMNNEWIDCKGLFCNRWWSDTSMLQCSRLGDCGYKTTFGKTFGNNSFFTTDMYNNPDGANQSLVRMPELVAGRELYYNLQPIRYSADSFSTSSFDCEDCTFEDMMNRINEYIEYLDSLDAEDLLIEYALNGHISIHTRHFTMCNPFVLYDEGDCDLCTKDITKPCTEYKCRSIGNNCKYLVDNNGYGDCISYDSSSDELSVDMSSVRVLPYSSLQESIFGGDIFGKEIIDNVPSFTTFEISFNTSHEAQCKSGIFPISMSDFPYSIDLTSSTPEAGFFINHTFHVYAIPGEYMLSDLNQLVNFRSYLQMMSLTRLDSVISGITTQMEDAIDDVTDYPGVDDSDFDPLRDIVNYTLETYYDSIRPVMEVALTNLNNYLTDILYGLDTGKSYIFFNCIDSSGNENDNFFVSYFLIEDIYPPVVVSTNISHNRFDNPKLELQVVMDEPSLCNISFDASKTIYEMEYKMSCTSSYYTVETGYPCVLNVTKTVDACEPSTNRGKIYLRCRDKPYLDIEDSNINTESYQIEYYDDCGRY